MGTYESRSGVPSTVRRGDRRPVPDPEQLENAAGKIKEAKRVYEEEAGRATPEPRQDGARSICSDPRRHRSR